MWQMIFDIVRFNQFALDLLTDEDESEIDTSGSNRYSADIREPRQQQSIGEYLEKHNYSEAFRDDYLIPMTASVWSTSPDKAALEFPAITLIRFLWNHHLLSTVAARPTWMTIPGGSKQYIDKVLADCPKSRIHLNVGINSVRSDSAGAWIERNDGVIEAYDHVVLATHGDQAAQIISGNASEEEIGIMAGFKTSENTAVLHSDLSVCVP